MSHTTINGTAVLEGTISLPRNGVWIADLVTGDIGPALTGAVTIQVGASLTLKGTIVRGGPYQGRRTFRIVGGAGGLSHVVTGRWYAGAPLSLPVRDLLTESGEALSTTADAALLSTTQTPGWCRTMGAASDALSRLANDAGATWRVLPDGTVWIGTDTWAEAPIMRDVMQFEDRKALGRVSIVSEAPTVLPGMSFRGQRVSYVELAVHEDQIRIELFVDQGSAVDRFKRGLVDLINAIVQPKIDYLAMYPCKVVGQNADLRLECIPDNTKLGPSIGPLPMRLGIPGATVKVKAGSRVLVGFENGDPRKPYAALWDTAALDELDLAAATAFKVTAGNVTLSPGGLPAARQGDMVGVGGGVPAVPNCTIVLFSGGPIVAGAPMPGYIGNVIVPTLPVYGVIQSGNPNVIE